MDQKDPATKEQNYWSPYLAGLAIGLTLILTYFVSSRNANSGDGLRPILACSGSAEICHKGHVNDTLPAQ